MKIYVLTLRDEVSKKRFQRLKDSAVAVGYKEKDIVPVYGRKAVDFEELCDEYGVETIDFYRNGLHDKQELNKAFSCTVGHVEIWKKIAFGHQGAAIICEDDVVFKALVPWMGNNTKIVWLGPRIWHEDDYQVPHTDFRVLDTERFEGTHAYMISEGMAQQLYYKFKKHGFDDSIDGQLGMRNIFQQQHAILDPPVAVAVVGDQVSTITGAEPAFWNAEHTPGFLEGLSDNARIPPLRQIVRLDRDWSWVRATILSEVESVKTALFLGTRDGDSAREIVDASGCQALIVDKFNNIELIQHNCYLSKYYYNINLLNNHATSTAAHFALEGKRFDLVAIETADDAADAMQRIALGWLMLNEGGLLLLRGVDNTFLNVFNGVNVECLMKLSNVLLLKKPKLA